MKGFIDIDLISWRIWVCLHMFFYLSGKKSFCSAIYWRGSNLDHSGLVGIAHQRICTQAAIQISRHGGAVGCCPSERQLLAAGYPAVSCSILREPVASSCPVGETAAKGCPHIDTAGCQLVPTQRNSCQMLFLRERELLSISIPEGQLPAVASDRGSCQQLQSHIPVVLQDKTASCPLPYQGICMLSSSQK